MLKAVINSLETFLARTGEKRMSRFERMQEEFGAVLPRESKLLGIDPPFRSLDGSRVKLISDCIFAIVSKELDLIEERFVNENIDTKDKILTKEKCPMCGSAVKETPFDYKSVGINPNTGQYIKIRTARNDCINPECKHSWLPHDREKQLTEEIRKIVNGGKS